MNRASSATGWVRNPTMKSPDLDPHLASSYELGWTWNPITGCLNGCPYCYARRLANGRLKKRYLANRNVLPLPDNYGKLFSLSYEDLARFSTDPFYPRFWMDRVVMADQRLKASKKPLGIFPCDMSDWCGIGIPESWSNWVLELARRYPQHRFYLLTKQYHNLANFSPFPENCFVGVTATNQEMLDLAIGHLRNIQAKVRFVSLEPFLEEMREPSCDYLPEFNFHCLDWIIIGAQTKPYSPPQKECVREIVRAADYAGIPVFQKDNLRPLLGDNLRQELPK